MIEEKISNFDLKSSFYGSPQIPHAVKILPTIECKSNFEKFRKHMKIFRLILLIIYLMSCAGVFFMWFTNSFDNYMYTHLELRQNSAALEWWKGPPIYSYLKVRFFNYTNTEDFLKGKAKKLIVEEVGPYVYKEKMSKTDIEFDEENHTISYRDHKISHFDPELTNGSENDIIINPNLVFLTSTKTVKSSSMFQKWGLQNALTITGSKVFLKRDVKSLLWGYEDELIGFLKNLPGNIISSDYEKSGLFIRRNGTGQHKYVIHTGEGDITKLNTFMSIDNQTKLNHWSTDECNKIDGTDGTQFPPNLVDRKQILNVYSMELARVFPLKYEHDVNIFDGIPTWRYEIPTRIFEHPDLAPENKCYCYSENICAPSGVYNATIFNEGAPIFLSFPHFYGGDKILFDKIDGLKPNKEKHRTYADVHPRLAFPIAGASRFQINVQVYIADYISGLEKLDEGDILPMFWFEIVPGPFPEYVQDMIYNSAYTANFAEIIFGYGSILIFIYTLSLLIYSIACCYPKPNNTIMKSLTYGIPSLNSAIE